MNKSIDFLNNITLSISHDFSDKAKAAGWDAACTNLCHALSFVLDAAKRLSDYERQDSTCSSYDGLYGADEICLNLPVATRRRYRSSYEADGISTYDSLTYCGGFYMTAYEIGMRMWGLTTAELPASQFPSLPVDFASTYNVALSTYKTMTTMLSLNGIDIGDMWTIDRFTESLGSNEKVVVNDPTSFYDGLELDNGYSAHNYFLQTPFRLFSAIANIRGHMKILKVVMDNTPTGARGGKTFPASYSLRDCLYSFPQFQPHDIVRIRQALTEVRAGYATNGYDPYSPGTSTTSISAGRIRNRIKKALSNRGITFATSEIPDKTKDISAYYNGQATINDPLIIAGAGFAMVEMADSHASTNNSWWGAFVPAVHLCRKYLMRSYMIAYDYKETTNPNAFEAANGKVAYAKSNRFVYLNSRCTGTQDWKVKAHNYDEYWTGSEKPYLNSISTTLRANIAKTALGLNPGEDLAQDIDKAWPPLHFREHWCFLPTLTMFGVENKKTSRAWSNVQLALDSSTYYEVSGNSGEWMGSAGLTEGDLNGEGMAFEDVDSCVDLIENGWELGNRKYQFKVNPECSDATTARDKLYIPTQTPAVYRADTQDTTIPNRIACFYLPKADGTATTSQLGYAAPYNTNPFTVAFALIPFHTTETDGLYKAYTGNPLMNYTATAYEDL